MVSSFILLKLMDVSTYPQVSLSLSMPLIEASAVNVLFDIGNISMALVYMIPLSSMFCTYPRDRSITMNLVWQSVWAKLPLHSPLLLNHKLRCNANVISASSLTAHKAAQIANAFGSTSIKHRSIWLTCVQSMSDRCWSVAVPIRKAVCLWHMCMTDETHKVLPISRN